MSQIRLNGSGAVEGAMAPYRDFVEKRPEGSRRQEILDVNRHKCDVLEEGVLGGHLEGAKGAPEGETP